MERYDKNKYIQVAEAYEKTKSLAETAKQIGLTKERVRQIQSDALKRLKVMMQDQDISHLFQE